MQHTRRHNIGTKRIPNTTNTITLNARLHKTISTTPLNSAQRIERERVNTRRASA
jgi:hypothetical protein